MIAVLITFVILHLLFVYFFTFRATMKYLRTRYSKDKLKRSHAFDNFFQCIIMAIGITVFWVMLVMANL